MVEALEPDDRLQRRCDAPMRGLVVLALHICRERLARAPAADHDDFACVPIGVPHLELEEALAAVHELEQLDVDLALGPASAKASAIVLALPRPAARSSTTISRRRANASRVCRYLLRLRPARAAAAGVPGQARLSRPPKLASENATRRSPEARSPRAITAAIAARLTTASRARRSVFSG